jgi:hypothetical protein
MGFAPLAGGRLLREPHGQEDAERGIHNASAGSTHLQRCLHGGAALLMHGVLINVDERQRLVALDALR